MSADPWLERWLPTLRERAGKGPVLEIGCGAGADTETLVNAGLSVTGFDLSEDAVLRACQRAPAARLSVQNVLDPFPLEGTEVGAVVASLSLHYFPWQQTLELVGRIRNTLRPGGLLLCRLNSTEDVNYGAAGHPMIQQDFYLVDGQPKRFFNRHAIAAAFAEGWRTLACEHVMSTKYPKPKALWEVALARMLGGRFPSLPVTGLDRLQPFRRPR